MSGSLWKKRRAGGFFCYLLFPIACFLYTLLPSPRDALELLIKHKFVLFWYTQREHLHYFGVYTAAMGFTHIWCYKWTKSKSKNWKTGNLYYKTVAKNTCNTAENAFKFLFVKAIMCFASSAFGGKRVIINNNYDGTKFNFPSFNC